MRGRKSMLGVCQAKKLKGEKDWGAGFIRVEKLW